LHSSWYFPHAVRPAICFSPVSARTATTPRTGLAARRAPTLPTGAARTKFGAERAAEAISALLLVKALGASPVATGRGGGRRRYFSLVRITRLELFGW